VIKRLLTLRTITYFFLSLLVLFLLMLWFGSTTHSSLKGSMEHKYSTFMDEKAADIQFNGSVLVAKDGQILFSKGYGFSDHEKQIQNSSDTLYNIASLTKSFIAVSILQLEEQQLLSTNDPLSKYISDFPDGNLIRIHHLLSHSSGIPEILKVLDSGKPYTPNDIINLMKEKQLDFKPGSKYSYSNTGYLILGYILEKVSGVSYPDYVKQHIFDPANMKNTYVGKGEGLVAVGYENMKQPE